VGHDPLADPLRHIVISHRAGDHGVDDLHVGLQPVERCPVPGLVVEPPGVDAGREEGETAPGHVEPLDELLARHLAVGVGETVERDEKPRELDLELRGRPDRAVLDGKPQPVLDGKVTGRRDGRVEHEQRDHACQYQGESLGPFAQEPHVTGR
jgi:hypothetical protein